ncbi:MAG TPA: kelch repeat-containing protein [Kofleriaceae bacterium]|jgi:cysteine-rich repeat protein
MRIALGLALLVAACVHTDSADCGGGKVCREGTVCAQITINAQTNTECVSEDQLDKCKGIADGMACDEGNGTCYSQACLPIGCGNGRIDSGEDCDDGNTSLGDGCSSSCKPEVCGNGTVDPVQIVDGTPLPNEQCDDSNTLSHDGCASTCLPEVLRWKKLSTTPQLRSWASMAVDLNTRKSIMFGGFIVDLNPANGIIAEPDYPFVGTPNGETWELSETGWTRVDAIPSPSPRGGHALVHDGKRTVLVGGAQSAEAIFGDVWALSDGVWSKLADLPAEMGPRAGAAAAYWPGHGVVLFGGLEGGESVSPSDTSSVKGDTWIMKDNTDTFVRLDLPTGAATPEARVFATLTYDPDDGGTLILVGGTTAYSEHEALPSWSLDANGWTPLPGGDAPSASGSVAAYDPVLGVVVADGMEKTFARTPVVKTWKNGVWTPGGDSPGGARYGASGGVDPITGHLTMFGGIGGVNLTGTCGPVGCTPGGGALDPSDTEVLSYIPGPKWAARNIVPDPPQLAKQSYAYDPDRARVVVFGGVPSAATKASGSGANSDGVTARVYELVEHTFFHPFVLGDPQNGAPVERHSAAAAYADFGTTRGTFFFGGSSKALGVAPLGDFWLLQADASGELQWHMLPGGPSARSGAGMVFDKQRGKLVMFGGSDSTDTRLADVCEYDGTAWSPCTTLPSNDSYPSPRADTAFAYDPKDHVVVMWGGIGPQAQDAPLPPVYDDLWTYDGSTWMKISNPFVPTAREGARFVWDARRERMVLWGATNTDTAIWELGGPHGTEWSFVPAFDAPELPRGYSMLVQSPAGGIIAHGGTVGGNDGETAPDVLELVRESTTATQYTSCNSQFDEDNDQRVGCGDQDCWAYCTPECAPGTSGPDCVLPGPMNPGCGDGRCDAPRENCGICPEDCHPEDSSLPACPVNP